MKKIMVVEDDVYLREEIVHTFSKEGYSVLSISSFESCEEEIIRSKPDLILLDVNLPGKSGFELCKILKSKISVPILILTACDTLSDELQALGLGADDFLTKPCQPRRLVARAVRLLETYKKIKNVIQADKLSLDLDTYKAVLGSAEVILPETEGKILQVLIEHYPAIVSGKEMLQLLWGGEEYVDENILQVNMTRLRKKLSSNGMEGIIRNMRGQGYYLEVTE